ncbi:MAG TPA: DUF3592 domain-containing protein [Phycisphaerales bacterium]|nr:DUF3592 domain-containing protein [Phycisphaerales bacterium]
MSRNKIPINPRFISYICGCIFLPMLFVGLMSLRAILKDRELAREIADWPSTKGTIVTSTYSTRSHRSSSDRTYSLDVQYTFEVNGQPYRGTKLFPGDAALTYRRVRQAEKALRAYPEGKTVTVYYDPKAPERAGLLRKPEVAATFGLAIGALFGLMGLCGTVFAVWLFRYSAKKVPNA